MLTCSDTHGTDVTPLQSPQTPPLFVTHIEVRHARFLELVPQPPRDDLDGDVVSDDSADAGQGGLGGTERGHDSDM